MEDFGSLATAFQWLTYGLVARVLAGFAIVSGSIAFGVGAGYRAGCWIAEKVLR